MYKKIALSLCFTLFLGLLTACSPNEILRLKKSESTQTLKDTETSSPIALPPSFGDKRLNPDQPQNTYMPNGLPALQPMKGINADTLFSKNIKNNGDRFNRVEGAVVDLRKEFDSYKPSIIRLAAVESDIQNLIKELEVLLQETPTNQQPINLINEQKEEHSETAQLKVEQLQVEHIKLEPEPEAKTPPPKETAKIKPKKEVTPPTKTPKAVKTLPIKKTKPALKPLPHHDGSIAKNLRAGEHANSLRIVIDTNKVTDFTIDLDNDEKLIIIELANARWIDNKNHVFNNLKLLESYSIEPINNGDGTMIILSLKKSTSIIRKKRLLPDNDTPYQRIYFDLSI